MVRKNHWTKFPLGKALNFTCFKKNQILIHYFYVARVLKEPNPKAFLVRIQPTGSLSMTQLNSMIQHYRIVPTTLLKNSL
jgi:hypothetical protein